MRHRPGPVRGPVSSRSWRRVRTLRTRRAGAARDVLSLGRDARATASDAAFRIAADATSANKIRMRFNPTVRQDRQPGKNYKRELLVEIGLPANRCSSDSPGRWPLINVVIDTLARIAHRNGAVMDGHTEAWRTSAIALAAGLLLTWASGSWADPPTRTVRLGYTTGEVSFLAAGANDWAEAVPNRPLWMGDRVWTAAGARAELKTGNAALRLAPGTSVSIVAFDDQAAQYELNQGTVRLRVRSLDRDGDRDRHAKPCVLDPQRGRLSDRRGFRHDDCRCLSGERRSPRHAQCLCDWRRYARSVRRN